MRVLVTGGGVAGLELLLALRDLAGDRVDLTLLEPREDFVYRPLSVREPFAGRAADRRSLDDITADLGVELRHDLLDRVEPAAKLAVTGGGQRIEYDQLVIALGARRVPAWPRVLTFRGEADSEAVHGLVQDLEAGYTRRVAFVVPPGITWTLPLYELALMTAQRGFDMSIESELTLITPEPSPLSLFGAEASRAVAELLSEAGIALETSAFADVPRGGEVVLRPGERELDFERIVALPLLLGPGVDGLPEDDRGFIPVDSHGAVIGVGDVWAAGDGTQFPVKQGGVATQQADAVASSIAAAAGADVEPHEFEPVLRGRLLTGYGDRFLRSEQGRASEVSTRSLWWPPSKIAGRYLAPYLDASEPPEVEGTELEVPLDPTTPTVRRRVALMPDGGQLRPTRLE